MRAQLFSPHHSYTISFLEAEGNLASTLSVCTCSYLAHLLQKARPGFKMLPPDHIILSPQGFFLCANSLIPAYKCNSKKSLQDLILYLYSSEYFNLVPLLCLLLDDIKGIFCCIIQFPLKKNPCNKFLLQFSARKQFYWKSCNDSLKEVTTELLKRSFSFLALAAKNLRVKFNTHSYYLILVS